MEQAKRGPEYCKDCTECVRYDCMFCDAYHYGHDHTKFYRCSGYRRQPNADSHYFYAPNDFTFPSASFNVTICPEERTIRIMSPDGSNPCAYYLDTDRMFIWATRAIQDWTKHFAKEI